MGTAVDQGEEGEMLEELKKKKKGLFTKQPNDSLATRTSFFFTLARALFSFQVNTQLELQYLKSSLSTCPHV